MKNYSFNIVEASRMKTMQVGAAFAASESLVPAAVDDKKWLGKFYLTFHFN
jgi:hypothetical protein